MKTKMERGFFDNHVLQPNAICLRSRLWLFNFENRERKGLFETLAEIVKESNNRAREAQCQPGEVQRRLDWSHARAERLWKQGW